MKLTDEQLSKVLFAHNTRILGPAHQVNNTPDGVCLIMCAFDKPTILIFDYTHAQAVVAGWFDRIYKPEWTEEELIEQLTQQGLI